METEYDKIKRRTKSENACLIANFPGIDLCDLLPVCVFPPIAARQRGLLFDKRRDQPSV
jgi:hypothetical protein